MLSTLLVLGGVLVGLVLLLALIVSLSARPAASTVRGAGRTGAPSYMDDAERPHPAPWSPSRGAGTDELRALR